MRTALSATGLCLMTSACAFDATGTGLADDPGPPDAEVAVDAALSEPDATPPAPDAALPPAAMVEVPGSQFTMGCPQTELVRCRADEHPARLVTLDAFAIDRTEVTRARYDDCVDAGKCTPPHCAAQPAGTPALPVVCVTWYQASDYCSWTGKRLPSEAEWEKAARGEGAAWFPWGDNEPNCALANFAGCGGELEPAGRHASGASAYGAHDIAGNAFEWVADWYESDYYDDGPRLNPAGPSIGQERVARGGSFRFDSYYMRSSLRSRDDPELWFDDLGFRCAKTL